MWPVLLLAGCVAPEAPRTADDAPSSDPGPPTFPAGTLDPEWAAAARPDGRMDATWRQGDTIPGWEDFECEELGEPVERWSLRGGLGSPVDKVKLSMGAVNVSGCPAERPSYWYVSLSSEELAEDGTEKLWMNVLGEGSHRPVAQARGQGWYLSTAARDCGTSGRSVDALINPDGRTGYGFMNDCTYDTTAVWDLRSWTALCLSRVRPDQIAGSLWMMPLPQVAGGLGSPDDYGWRVVDFVVDFPLRGGVRLDQDGVYALVPDDVQRVRYEYGPQEEEPGYWCGDADYDHAWPWADISDPFVRDIVYWRYRPWALEDYGGEEP